MSTSLVIGSIGATIILVLFLLNQMNKLKNDSFWYDFFNFLGSAFLFISALMTKSWPFVVLNFVWGAFSLFDIVKFLAKRR